MQYIGKADKFYTLWEVTVDTRTSCRGNTYKVVNHQYIKNISFDKNKAIHKYPNAIVDESLRGHHSWSSYEYEKLPSDEFRGGKYRGEKIANCTDYSYLHWAWNNTNIIPYESQELVIGILESVGYRKINDSRIATPYEVEQIDNSFKEVERVQEILERDGKITITSTKNLDNCGNLYFGNINYIFPNYKELEYAGYVYSLPIDSNGKAKRIKNKEVEIISDKFMIIPDKYGWGPELIIDVKDFKVK